MGREECAAEARGWGVIDGWMERYWVFGELGVGLE